MGPGLRDRVIYRELFPFGLTVADLSNDVRPVAVSLAHVAARQEMRSLMHGAGAGQRRAGRSRSTRRHDVLSLIWLALAAIAVWALVRLGRQIRKGRNRGQWRVAATLFSAVMLAGGGAGGVARGVSGRGWDGRRGPLSDLQLTHPAGSPEGREA
jgi:hypothetical protein